VAYPKIVSPTGRDITLRPVRQNAGLEAAYRKRLTALVDEMHASLLYWLGAAYKANALVALDESPAAAMRAAMRKMSRRWQRNFDKGADKLANWFANSGRKYSDIALKGILKDAGFTVSFSMTPAMTNVIEATVAQNVTLITNIAAQHLATVEGLVMRSVASGRDLSVLSRGLQTQFGITKRRAAFIARQENNKASAVIARTRQAELGITEGVWRHSAAGKEPRASHIAANGKTFSIATGMRIDGEFIMPGEIFNCRCTWSPVIAGFID
jgi:SPP1 gp7 family putative phage head morphogenesis protein